MEYLRQQILDLTLKSAKPLPDPRTPYNMKPEDTAAKFTDLIEQFDLIDSQPSDTNLTRIKEVVAPLLLQIPYDKNRRDTQPHRPH